MDMTLEDCKEVQKEKEIIPLPVYKCVGWTSKIEQHPDVMKYLINNNCIDAWEASKERFFYDRIKQRVVFVEYDTINTMKLATGRSLNGIDPKWLKYVALPGEVFKIKKKLTLDEICANIPTVIVEDCASACSVSRVADAIALCGTSYNLYSLINKLQGVRDVFVCLDADAMAKSIKLQFDLLGAGNFNSVGVLNPRDDLKYIHDKHELIELIS